MFLCILQLTEKKFKLKTVFRLEFGLTYNFINLLGAFKIFTWPQRVNQDFK